MLTKRETENTLKYWEGSPEKLLRFWKTISSHNIFYDSALSLLKNNWDISKKVAAQMFPYYKNFIDEIASGESVRRYYSTKKMIVQVNLMSLIHYFILHSLLLYLTNFLITPHRHGGTNIAVNH